MHTSLDYVGFINERDLFLRHQVRHEGKAKQNDKRHKKVGEKGKEKYKKEKRQCDIDRERMSVVGAAIY